MPAPEREMRVQGMQCVLLNADYTFLNMVHWKRAMCLIAKGKVHVLRESEKAIRGAEGLVIQIPAVMRLIKLIRTLYKNRVPFSKKNVLIRDGFRCAYCGAEKVKLTIDHIIPRSRGGTTCFENCVTSCKFCNTRKASRIPSEVNMFLRVKAYQPTIAEFLLIKIRNLGLYDTLKDLGIY
ncbi:MAG: HNH endonuclease [Desulfobacterales bacterium CG23_combo_of_CG06-09_8_20_14_all_52_9]|nr:MAG: HNH endonuclease [Desulfobacterales bacterium CG23_combo_of_CG06-09_8_20_14_all_52_9]